VADEWDLHLEPGFEATLELSPQRHGEPASWRDVLAGWRLDASFAEAFGACLASAPCDAFFWETPALVTAGLDQPFRCVLVDAPALARRAPEPLVFAHEFQGAGEDGVACFDNLGGDALLVVPAQRGDPQHFGHLAAFLRGALVEQRRALWRAVAEAVEQRLGERPVWLSTSGLGVSWLHVRLDDRPKYYQHGPFRAAP
jgi:hypothetical protein